MVKKIFGPIFKELLKFLPKKFSICSQIYGFRIRDPGSGIRKKPIPDPRSRGQKGTGSRIRIRNTDYFILISPSRTTVINHGVERGDVALLTFQQTMSRGTPTPCSPFV